MRKMLSKTTSSGEIAFPWKLHMVLEESFYGGFEDVISWIGHNAFKVHDPIQFEETIMQRYFNQTQYKSFQRQRKYNDVCDLMARTIAPDQNISSSFFSLLQQSTFTGSLESRPQARPPDRTHTHSSSEEIPTLVRTWFESRSRRRESGSWMAKRWRRCRAANLCRLNVNPSISGRKRFPPALNKTTSCLKPSTTSIQRWIEAFRHHFK